MPPGLFVSHATKEKRGRTSVGLTSNARVDSPRGGGKDCRSKLVRNSLQLPFVCLHPCLGMIFQHPR